MLSKAPKQLQGRLTNEGDLGVSESVDILGALILGTNDGPAPVGDAHHYHRDEKEGPSSKAVYEEGT